MEYYKIISPKYLNNELLVPRTDKYQSLLNDEIYRK